MTTLPFSSTPPHEDLRFADAGPRLVSRIQKAQLAKLAAVKQLNKGTLGSGATAFQQVWQLQRAPTHTSAPVHTADQTHGHCPEGVTPSLEQRQQHTRYEAHEEKLRAPAQLSPTEAQSKLGASTPTSTRRQIRKAIDTSALEQIEIMRNRIRRFCDACTENMSPSPERHAEAVTRKNATCDAHAGPKDKPQPRIAAAVGQPSERAHLCSRVRRRDELSSRTEAPEINRGGPGGIRRREICTFFMQGCCKKGEDCGFLHEGVPSRRSEVCKYFVAGNCAKNDGCLFSHDLKSSPCRRLNIDKYCPEGDSCRFSHAELSDIQLQEFKASLHHRKQSFESSGFMSAATTGCATRKPSDPELQGANEVSEAVREQAFTVFSDSQQADHYLGMPPNAPYEAVLQEGWAPTVFSPT